MKTLTCKECEKLIPVFLDEKLRSKDIERFKEHIESCPACKEELAIEYLSSEGIVHLESGTSFHLENELRGYMTRALAAKKRTIRWRIGLISYEAVALLIIFGIFMYAAG
ncbi:MAG: zf-HC2 domain-containing protein [Lachnospiraceae bacterium]|nr:zf-HC2 domain-containing protein [Lachnospiraceae bacterium]